MKKIQSIAARAEAEGAVLLVAGDAAHPEVQGIVAIPGERYLCSAIWTS